MVCVLPAFVCADGHLYDLTEPIVAAHDVDHLFNVLDHVALSDVLLDIFL
jgi:hypothetical protein